MADSTSASLLAAGIAALGYVGNLAVNTYLAWRQSVRERKAKLIALQSLLFPSNRLFHLQASLSAPLIEEFRRKDATLEGLPNDVVLARGYAAADERQKFLHGLIRQYTVSAMRPLNLAMLDWLAADTYYKLNTHTGDLKELSLALRGLEAHLVLWRAKFDYLIPNRPEQALVYMGDEQGETTGFPVNIDYYVERLAGGTPKMPEPAGP